MYIKHLSETFSGPSEKWKNMPSLLSEKWKVKMFGFHSFSRGAKWKVFVTLFREVKCWLKMTRDLEVKFLEKFWEISRNEICFVFFCFPKSALNMVWNLISPPHRRYVQGWVTDNTRIHSFSKNRSEKYIAFNFSRSEKWKQYSFHFLLRSESEIELNRNREREVEFVKKNLENSRERRFSQGTGHFEYLSS